MLRPFVGSLFDMISYLRWTHLHYSHFLIASSSSRWSVWCHWDSPWLLICRLNRVRLSLDIRESCTDAVCRVRSRDILLRWRPFSQILLCSFPQISIQQCNILCKYNGWLVTYSCIAFMHPLPVSETKEALTYIEQSSDDRRQRNLQLTQ